MVHYPAGSSHGDMVAIKVTHGVHGGHKAKDPYGHDTISIVPIISKVAEKWVSNLLTNHLHKGINSLHPMQFGFR